MVDNSIENYRCYVGNCRGLVDRTAPLEEQALAQAAFSGFSGVVVFDEPGWFIKMRELSLTFYAPGSLGPPIRAPAALSLTLAGQKSLDDHRLQRGGPGGQRLWPGQLFQPQRLRIAAAGALLDRAPQPQLLRRVTRP